jgi:predicted Co/Zn/Cd cation transporter (cation efflux family)
MKNWLARISELERKHSLKYVPYVIVFFGGYLCAELLATPSPYLESIGNMVEKFRAMDFGTMVLYTAVVSLVCALTIWAFCSETHGSAKGE